jgi:hypothetical protein
VSVGTIVVFVSGRTEVVLRPSARIVEAKDGVVQRHPASGYPKLNSPGRLYAWLATSHAPI